MLYAQGNTCIILEPYLVEGQSPSCIIYCRSDYFSLYSAFLS